MNDNKREHLSSLIDNENCSDDQLTDVLSELYSSEKAADTWQSYHLIGDTLRDELNNTMAIDISADIAKAIANEPTVFSPKSTNNTSDTDASSNTGSSPTNETVQTVNKPSNVFTFKAKITQLVKPLGQMAIAASAAGLMILSVQNNNESIPDFESVIPSAVVQTMPFAGVADPVSFNYSNKNNAGTTNGVNNAAKEQALEQQARIEQKRRFQALLIDHQQQIKLSQYSTAVSEK